jgi:predicted amidohydrolase
MAKSTQNNRRVRVGAVQMISSNWDLAGNVHKALSFCDRAAKKGVQILCFPECASTGFDWVQQKPPTEDVPAEPIPGPIVRRFAEKAKQTNIYIIFGMAERPRGSKRLYNTAFLVGPEEGYMGRYRKILSERVFTDGREANVFETRHGTIGIYICADMRSPDISRLLVAKGAKVLFQPTNYFHPDGIDIKSRYAGKATAQRSRAMDNGVHLVVANAGREEYVNDSRIIAPFGQGPEPQLARATHREQLLTADIEFDRDRNLIAHQAKERPWLFKEMGETMVRLARA